MDLSKIKEKLKSSPKVVTYALIVLVCIALLLLMNTSDNDEVKNYDSELNMNDTQFKESVEKQLEDIVSKIDGVGRVTVMVTVESTYSYEYVTDRSDSDLKTVIVGNKEALISKITNPKIVGVLIVCQGGDNVKVKEKIINAVSTVLDIPMSKVYVAKYDN
ncbi:MAG: hypothetical protein IJ424_03825 [Oscillospiraceae bacterium]|nr:hypothetical protein [Oscillospiraceae bacterium]